MMSRTVERKRQLILNDDTVSKSKLIGNREKPHRREILAPQGLNLLHGHG